MGTIVTFVERWLVSGVLLLKGLVNVLHPSSVKLLPTWVTATVEGWELLYSNQTSQKVLSLSLSLSPPSPPSTPPPLRGDHTDMYERVTLKDLKQMEEGSKGGSESENTKDTKALKGSDTL